jgi:translation initiation factor 1A
MPKRKSKGQRRKTNKGPQKRELEYKDDSQEYAQVVRMLGNSRCQVQCFDGVSRLAHIRGNMRKKVWIKLSDFVLVSLRDYQDNKCDIIMKYTSEEVRNLKSYGELPETVCLDLVNEEETELPFDFDDI